MWIGTGKGNQDEKCGEKSSHDEKMWLAGICENFTLHLSCNNCIMIFWIYDGRSETQSRW